MAAKKRLATVVYVDGEPYGPGEVPASIAKKIDNPKVWASDEEPAADEDAADEAGDDAGDADES